MLCYVYPQPAEMQPGNAQQTMNCLKHPSPTYDYESHHVTGDENN